ncbi:MAG: hypothetical protein RLZ98_1370 [Pseudomonadota bacterium]|jgi:anthranilate 1,2-dioxygenase small subunit
MSAGLKLPHLPDNLGTASLADLHFVISQTFAAYTNALDDDELERWPDFFVDETIYKVIPRENYDNNLPLAVMYCANRRMMLDRVAHIRETAMFAPRRHRHVSGDIRITGIDGNTVGVNSNYAVFETTRDVKTQVFNVGRYIDQMVVVDGGLKFRQRYCVFDSSLIPTSLIYPV